MAHRAVHVVQRIRARPAEVFDAWVTPETIVRFLPVGPDSRIVDHEIETEVGGGFSFVEESAEGRLDQTGSYLELSPPDRLAFTLSVPRHFPGATEVIVDIVETAEGCELTLVQTGVAPDVTEESWRRRLALLAKLLEDPLA